MQTASRRAVLGVSFGLLLGTLLAAGTSHAQTFTTLYTFTGGADGGNPGAGLISDSAGNFYGTTESGGNGYGVVFKLDSAGNETVLYTFTGGPDGRYPQAGLTLDSAGNLYGTTENGGSFGGSCPSVGCGVVFKLDPSGNETVLHTFTGGGDGAQPQDAPILDVTGNLYGTTRFGGTGSGVVFELDAAGNETVLHTFTGGADGAIPLGGLVRDASGNLYGTTGGGGANGKGAVFELDSAGNETVLHSFTGVWDGNEPSGNLVLNAAGKLFGTTIHGGLGGPQCARYGGCGVVYEVDSTGHETVLYTFQGLTGGQPVAGLTLSASNEVYRVALGGSHGAGVIFKLGPAAGHASVLHVFTGGTDGGGPVGALLSYQGSLYGTTVTGALTYGTVFRFDP